MDSPYKGRVTRKRFSFDDVIMMWVGVGVISKVMVPLNHVGESLNLFSTTTEDIWIIPSFRIWGYVLHAEHISSCVITNCGQHQWVFPFSSLLIAQLSGDTLVAILSRFRNECPLGWLNLALAYRYGEHENMSPCMGSRINANYERNASWDGHQLGSAGPGPRLNIKTVLSTYGDFHVKDKTAVRTSYL